MKSSTMYPAPSAENIGGGTPCFLRCFFYGCDVRERYCRKRAQPTEGSLSPRYASYRFSATSRPPFINYMPRDGYGPAPQRIDRLQSNRQHNRPRGNSVTPGRAAPFINYAGVLNPLRATLGPENPQDRHKSAASFGSNGNSDTPAFFANHAGGDA